MKKKLIVLFLLVGYLLLSCAPIGTLTPSVLPATNQPISTLTYLQVEPTGTEIQLPFVGHLAYGEYCDAKSVADFSLPIADAQGMNEEEIAGKLVSLWLTYFHNLDAPGFCRIDGFAIEEVSYDESWARIPIEPKGDFLRRAMFSVKLIQLPSFWMSWPGEIDQDNWLHTGHLIAVFRSEAGYTFAFAGP